MSKIRVLVADDHLIIREGILGMLSRCPVVELVGQAKDGQEAMEKARELMPDVILMDLRMPHLDGVAATEQIVAESPHTKVLVLTVSDESKDLLEAVKAGAKGYLLKDVQEEELVGAIQAINRGESMVNPAMAADLLEEFRKLDKEPARDPNPLAAMLTDREQEVLKFIADGLDNKDIAKELYVSKSTVKNHVSNILSKLQLRNRTEAAAFAVRERIIGSAD